MSLMSQSAELAQPGAAQLARAEPSLAGVEDFVALMKPRVMSLVVFTALVGMVVAPGTLHPVLGFAALLCIAIGAGASGALNMWYDADIDAVMTRTKNRPIPAGRVKPGEALGYGVTLALGSVIVLGIVANWLAAVLLCGGLYGLAQAFDAAEHRDRRCRRRVSADDRLGGGDRRHRH
jgi:heme O synthase-like polyprenyltransferase